MYACMVQNISICKLGYDHFIYLSKLDLFHSPIDVYCEIFFALYIVNNNVDRFNLTNCIRLSADHAEYRKAYRKVIFYIEYMLQRLPKCGLMVK